MQLARSRSWFATGLLLPRGIPQIFMGREFLEDKRWSWDPASSNLIWGGIKFENRYSSGESSAFHARSNTGALEPLVLTAQSCVFLNIVPSLQSLDYSG